MSGSLLAAGISRMRLVLATLALPVLLHAQVVDADAYLSEQRVKARQALETWRAAKSATEKESLAGEVIPAAVRGQFPEPIFEVMSSGGYPGRQIAIPETAREIRLHVLTPLDEEAKLDRDERFPWVMRRISAKTFEAWQPRRGLLFDSRGHILNEARPPRRDGHGREWYGAFLPDGRWITTDLWEFDRTLTLFSASGKYRMEIPAARLIPRKPDDFSTDLIGWARSDRTGDGWLVSVGSDGGRGIAYVSPDGTHRPLNEKESPSALCQPRDLEPKGTYTFLSTPSDDGRLRITRSEAAHGNFVGFPAYTWSPASAASVVLPDGDHDFGFWPASHAVFLQREVYRGPNSPLYETWFYNGPREFTGWLAARHLGDGPGNSLLFLTPSNHVVTLSPGLRIDSSVRFTDADGRPATPEKIFPDLRLGFFRLEDRLVLAQWKGDL